MSTMVECLALHEALQNKSCDILMQLTIDELQAASIDPDRYLSHFSSVELVEGSRDLARAVAQLSDEDFEKYYVASKKIDLTTAQESSKIITQRLLQGQLGNLFKS